MNNQFQGSRSPNQRHLPFYNPQKEAPNPNNPTLYQNNNSTTTSFFPTYNSKSYGGRPNPPEVPKQVINSSANFKTISEVPSKNTTGSIASSTISNNYPVTFPGKSVGSQMAKSLIHQTVKSPQSSFGHQMQSQKPSFLSNTPNRRAPRMSESNQVDINSPQTKAFDYKSIQDQSMELPVTKKLQNNFFKHKNNEKQDKMTKGQNSSGLLRNEVWPKSTSIVKRKGPCASDFKKIKQLGSGKYGQVFLVQQKNTGFMCALKMIQKKIVREEQIIQQFIRQIKIQMYLMHPNIIKLFGFFEDDRHFYIILEVGTGGQLYHHMKKAQPMPENKVAPIMKQICEAVNEIHSLRIIHRDIKPQNIVLHDNVVKLCDFGWSVYLDNKLRSTFCGTPLYVCPQILKGKDYDQKIDIWSIGIMMYQMLVGENPFKITKEEELIKIVKEEVSIPSYVFVSREGRDFLDKCLKKNPVDRVSIKQLLNHEFFLKNQQKNDKKIAF